MPFLIALAIAAAVLVRVLAPRFKLATPTSLVGGLWMGVATLSVGTILRRVLFGDGTAMVFVVVTTAWIVGLMAGWRLVYTVSRRLMASRT